MPLFYEITHGRGKDTMYWRRRWPDSDEGTPPPVESFCFLLDSDPGTGVDELLLDSSTTGVSEFCLQLDTST